MAQRSKGRTNSAGGGPRTNNEAPPERYGAGTESAQSQYDGELSSDPTESYYGSDVVIQEGKALTVIQHVQQCFDEADKASRIRRRQSEANWYAYMGFQDWSGKVKGQSREFIPKTSIAVEQLCFYLKKAMTSFGDYFQVDVNSNVAPNIPLTGDRIKDLIEMYLARLPDGATDYTSFDVRCADALKVGILQSLMIFKVYGCMKQEKRYTLTNPQPVVTPFSGQQGRRDARLVKRDVTRWRLCVDLIRPEDYYPDPSGLGLYEIHKSERDLWEVMDLAEQGLYDMDAVLQLKSSYERVAQERRKDQHRGQERTQPPNFRKKVVLMEYWGTLLDEDGYVAQRNIVTTIADDHFLIRPPEPNPFWHGESPFVVAPLIRVPFGVWHKAVYDSAASLNLAINELFNLILDGGISSVWGIRQVRGDMLEDPEQISDGIGQGVTLSVKNELPAGEKVLERVDEGAVPQDAMAVYSVLNGEFNSAALTTALKMGQMPDRRVLATEVQESSQGQDLTLEGILGTLEQQALQKVIRKAWLCILQDADNLLSDDVVAAIGAPAAVTFRRMTPAQRFALLANPTSIKVFGLTAVLAKAQNFQKQAALMQIVGSNPLLMQQYQRKFSSEKQLDNLMRSLNLNPEDLEKTPEEIAQNDQELQRMQQMGNILNGPGQGAAPGGPQATGQASPNTAGPGQASTINQLTTPNTGMVGNA